MNLSPKKRSTKGFAAVSAAFLRSLKNLEIEPARFRALPLKQRKLALSEAIYKTAKQVSWELNWYEDRSDLKSKKIWDFTIDQISQHQTIVDALIALVCLGETAFIKPLVSYLSFPEPRWSILIDSVLTAITSETTHGATFRIPSAEQLSAWRKWALEHQEPPKIIDYSDVLLSDIGIDEAGRYYFFTNSSASTDSSFLINRNEFFHSDWKYFDERQATFCSTSLYGHLKNYEFDLFANALRDFMVQNPAEGNFNTVVACTNDWISELNLSKSSLKEDWVRLITKDLVDSRTGAVLFQILVYPRKDRALAREFSKRMLKDEGNIFFVAVVSDILTQSQTSNAISRIARAYADIHNTPRHTRDALDELGPMASTMVTLWIENLFSREIESFCILGGEKRPNARLALIEPIVTMLHTNDQSLLKLRVFHHSSSAKSRSFAKRIEQFHEMRKPLIQELIRKGNTAPQIVPSYLRLISLCFNTLKSLRISKWLTSKS